MITLWVKSETLILFFKFSFNLLRIESGSGFFNIILLPTNCSIHNSCLTEIKSCLFSIEPDSLLLLTFDNSSLGVLSSFSLILSFDCALSLTLSIMLLLVSYYSNLTKVELSFRSWVNSWTILSSTVIILSSISTNSFEKKELL